MSGQRGRKQKTEGRRQRAERQKTEHSKGGGALVMRLQSHLNRGQNRAKANLMNREQSNYFCSAFSAHTNKSNGTPILNV